MNCTDPMKIRASDVMKLQERGCARPYVEPSAASHNLHYDLPAPPSPDSFVLASSPIYPGLLANYPHHHYSSSNNPPSSPSSSDPLGHSTPRPAGPWATPRRPSRRATLTRRCGRAVRRAAVRVPVAGELEDELEGKLGAQETLELVLGIRRCLRDRPGWKGVALEL